MLSATQFYCWLVAIYSLPCCAMAQNIILLYLLISRKNYIQQALKITSVTRTFLINLIISDFISCCLAIPTLIFLILNNEYSFWPNFCRIVPFLQLALTTVSSYTLAAVAIQWYNSPVVKAHKQPVSLKQSLLMVVLIWLMAFVVASPMLAYAENVRLEWIDQIEVPMLEFVRNYFSDKRVQKVMTDSLPLEKCSNKWGLTWHFLSYLFQTFLISHLIPFLICAFCYLKIVKVVWSKNNQSSENEINSFDIEVVRMMFACTVYFVLCWLPFNLVNIVCHYLYHATQLDHFSTISNVCFWLGQSSALFKPLIYMCFNRNFWFAHIQMVDSKLRNNENPTEGNEQSNEEIIRYSTLLDKQEITNVS